MGALLTTVQRGAPSVKDNTNSNGVFCLLESKILSIGQTLPYSLGYSNAVVTKQPSEHYYLSHATFPFPHNRFLRQAVNCVQQICGFLGLYLSAIRLCYASIVAFIRLKRQIATFGFHKLLRN
jgi:hypothetical protein